MRAVAITAPGGPDVLSVIEREAPHPGPGEVRIAVRAAAVNPTDISLREHGDASLDPPWTPGMDAAGTIESLGEGSSRLRLGEAVMAALSPRRPQGGAQAELIVVPEASAVPLPEGASFAQASTLPMNGLTALLGLELLDLQPGQLLVVSGGAGLLASYVIPLARERGVRVVADAAPADAELVASFGADEVIARGAGFAEAVRALAPAGADALFDTAVLGRSAFPALRDGGAVAVVRGWDGSETERGLAIHQVFVRTVLERTDWLLALSERASRGELALRVAGEFPPEGVAEAQRRLAAGGLRGRDVLVF